MWVRYHLALCCALLASAAVLAQSASPASTAPAAAPSTNPVADFKAELTAAAHATGVKEKVRHLRAAAALRPGDPENIVAEFQIGIVLSQYTDPAVGHASGEAEALAVFEAIVANHDHKAYYRSTPDGRSNSPELMVPQAAILAASTLRALYQENAKAREYLLVAMQDLAWTFQHRTEDWLNAPKPAWQPQPHLNQMELRVLDNQVAAWEKRKSEAAAGRADMGVHGRNIIEAAVRQYGLSYGPQRPSEVRQVMQPLVDQFAGTPIADVAAEHIAKAESLGAASTAPTSRGALATSRSVAPVNSGASVPPSVHGDERARFRASWPYQAFGSGAVAVLMIIYILRRRRAGRLDKQRAS